jgi:hypothetical protein
MDYIKKLIYDLTYLLDNVFEEVSKLYDIEDNTKYPYYYKFDDTNDIPYNKDDINLFWYYVNFSNMFIKKFYNDYIIKPIEIIEKFYVFSKAKNTKTVEKNKSSILNDEPHRKIYFDEVKRDLESVKNTMIETYKNEIKDK